MNKNIILKDDKLNSIILNKLGNVAQFISVEPGEKEKVKYIVINNTDENEARNLSIRDLIALLIQSARTHAVNIRSFSLSNMKGNKLIYNKTIEDLDEIMGIIIENSKEGKYSIINENIDINDGGVSGVVFNNIVEFAPKDTPKCVDKKDVCMLPKDMAFSIFEKIYGFKPKINFDPEYRVEFSIHPNKEGVYKEHTIIWEYEHYEVFNGKARISWPNKFSKFLGDKVFGLIVADYLGLKVPFTTVIAREVAPFSFGKETGSYEKWIRTCPVVKEPGKYYTGNYWTDPFALMNEEERKGTSEINIASILSQSSVESIYAGAAHIKDDPSKDVIEGVQGNGDFFMVGRAKPSAELPIYIIEKVKRLNNKIRKHYELLGDVSIEWVFDGEEIWVVQLNQIKNGGYNNIIVSGTPNEYQDFYVDKGLESLRDLISQIKGKNIGLNIIGDVGITSHFGDLLRLNNIPSKVIK